MSVTTRHSRAELLKTTCGRGTAGSLIGGVLWCALTGYGYYTSGSADPQAAASGAVTADVVRAWMMMLLFSAISCALIVTRDFSHGEMSRAVVAYGGRKQVFLAKLTAAAVTALGFACVAMTGAAANVALVGLGEGAGPVWTDACTRTLAGVGASVALAGLWGLMVGWLMRNQTLAVIGIVVLVVGVEPALQRLVPDAAGFLFTIALSAVYQDTKPDLLPAGAGMGVSVLWIVLLGTAARTAFLRRDVG